MNAPSAKFGVSRRRRAHVRLRASRAPILASLERRRLQSYLALMTADVAAIASAFFIASFWHGGKNVTIDFMQLVIPVFVVVASNSSAYSWRTLQSVKFGAWKAIWSAILSFSFVVVALFYVRVDQSVSRFEITLGATLSVVLLTVGRVLMWPFVKWRCGSGITNQLVIMDGGPAIKLSGATYVSADIFRLTPCLTDPQALDRFGMAIRNADRVIVSSVPERAALWALVMKGANVEGEIVDESVSRMAAQGARLVDGQGLLQVSSGPLGLKDRIQKRLLDLFVAGLSLLILAPGLLIVALAIKLEDGGPVFFRQQRVGRSNRFFSMLKFRSMSVNQEGLDGAQSASRNDERVTRVGKIIRATSVDELPQLLNVLLGHMSLVGPRPHALGSLAGDKLFWEVDQRYWQRHALKPGLTGLAQIRGYRGATDTEDDLSQRLNADLEYLHGWTLGRDIWIMLSTFRVLIHDRAF